MQSQGGHRAVVLLGTEGSGRTTALRHFVQLVTSASSAVLPPVVVARLVSWPGRTAVDLLHDVVTQLSAAVDRLVGRRTEDDDDVGVQTFIGRQHVDLDGLLNSYSALLRAFSESGRARLVIAVDGLENVRRGSSIRGGDVNSWLAVRLPACVHVVATYLIGEQEPANSSPLAALVEGGAAVRTIDVSELAESAVNQMVVDAFRRRRRTPPVDGRLAVLTRLIGSKPRAGYVTLMAEEFAARSTSAAAATHGDEKPLERLENIEKVAKERFKRAERHYGKSVVCTTMPVICSQRRGSRFLRTWIFQRSRGRSSQLTGLR